MFLGIHTAVISKEASGFRGMKSEPLKSIRKVAMFIVKLALLPFYGLFVFGILVLHAMGILDDPYMRTAPIPKGMRILPNGLVVNEPK